MDYKEKFLLVFGLLSALFLFLIQDAVVPSIFTFFYLMRLCPALLPPTMASEEKGLLAKPFQG